MNRKEYLKQFDARRKEIMRAYRLHGSRSLAAKALGISRQFVSRVIRQVGLDKV